MLTIISIVLFIYVLVRLQSVEKKLDDVLKGRVSPAPRMSVPVAPGTSPQPAGQSVAPVNVPQPITARPLSAEPVFTAHDSEVKHGAQSKTEFAVGSRVLTGVGVVALFLGVGFFLRYAFENNLISETTRVLLGLVFGVIAIGLGHVLRKKYDTYGYTIIGAGFGILFLSVYAAHSFYALIGSVVAFFTLIVITALGVGSALYYNSRPLVAYSFFGAFIIPLILPLSLSVHVLFTYLLVLNLGVLLVARFKKWPGFTVGSLFGTSIIYISWLFGPYNPLLFTETFMYSTCVFFIYFVTSLLNFVYRDRDYKGIDGLLLYGIPVLYFFLNFVIVSQNGDVSLFALAIGVFYILVSILLRTGFEHVGDLRKFSNALLLIAAPFIAGATALHFDGSALTIMLALEALVMMLVGYILKTSSNRIGGIILIMLTSLRMLVIDIGLPANSQIVWNDRTVTIGFVAIVFAFMWRLYSSYIHVGDSATEDEKKGGEIVGSLGVFFTILLWISLEMQSFVDNYMLYLPIVWLVYLACMLCIAFVAHSKPVRTVTYFMIYVTALIAFMSLSGLDLERHLSFANIRVVTALAFAAFSLYLSWLFKVHSEVVSGDEKKMLAPILLLGNLLVLWAFTLEIVGYFNKNIMSASGVELRSSIENTKRVVLSVFWLGYALAGLAFGILKRSHVVRYFSITLFIITIFKIFLYDTANLSDVYKFVSFILLGVILLIAGFAYYRFKDRITNFVTAGEDATKNS